MLGTTELPDNCPVRRRHTLAFEKSRLEIYQATSNIDWPLASVGNLALLVMAFVVVSAFNRLIRLAET